MRILARLVFLLAFALTQAAAVECPMASAAHEHAEAHSGPASHHAAAPAHGHPSPSHHHDAPHHERADCGLVMSCGTAAAASTGSAAPRMAASASRAPARAAQRYASPVIPIDAPPPRPLAVA